VSPISPLPAVGRSRRHATPWCVSADPGGVHRPTIASRTSGSPWPVRAQRGWHRVVERGPLPAEYGRPVRTLAHLRPADPNPTTRGDALAHGRCCVQVSVADQLTPHSAQIEEAIEFRGREPRIGGLHGRCRR